MDSPLSAFDISVDFSARAPGIDAAFDEAVDAAPNLT